MKISTALLSVPCVLGLAFQANAALIETNFEGFFHEVEFGDSPYELWGGYIFSGSVKFDSLTPVTYTNYDYFEYPGGSGEETEVTYLGAYNNALSQFSLLVGDDRFYLDKDKVNTVTINGMANSVKDVGVFGGEYYDFSFSAWLEDEGGNKLKVSYMGAGAYRDFDVSSGVLHALPTGGYAPSSAWISFEGYDKDEQLLYKINSCSGCNEGDGFKVVSEPASILSIFLGLIGLVVRKYKI
ncbi:hypothetical protein ONV78_20075 [Hahella sp. CR1]|uniref:hypothetical protein n=1 Tax=Hahella sp. CR1 TaxID=2992807 RepID=UPI002442C34D|nr:hypothetical protein [Hahella sp. CR1]MDG9670045.1 hypothetical protein [Hahella sp. CR1]